MIDETFKKYLETQVSDALKYDMENMELFEAIVRNIETHPVTGERMGMQSYRSWKDGETTFTLYYKKIGQSHYDVVFTDDGGKVDTTGKFKGPVLHAFSGFIMSMKLFIQDHKDLKTFQYSVMTEDTVRTRIYTRAISMIEKEIGLKYMGDHKEKGSLTYFFEVVDHG